MSISIPPTFTVSDFLASIGAPNREQEDPAEVNAYENFKLQWMLDHGFTLTNLIQCMSIMVHEYPLDPSDPEALQKLFDAWEFGVGFEGGQIWPCFYEFLENEFQNQNHI